MTQTKKKNLNNPKKLKVKGYQTKPEKIQHRKQTKWQYHRQHKKKFQLYPPQL